MYQIGDVLSVPKFMYRHYMIVVGPGEVAHGSKEKGCVTIEKLKDVTKNREPRHHGRWSSLPDREIVLRAKKIVGTPYRLFSDNCEHVVREISGKKRSSPQVVTAMTCLGIAVLFLTTRGKSA
ncbi:MAG TPA: hypothetical protein DIW51_05815 [Rhodospirillaceae bacterium]|nr:hypothetical protein [Magnetovibrio sp.]HBT41727.1 hypothetical protein [Rhodospirillaceae bacterium]HCS69471.1 hypothetical protein [Rhodospirillaceae bacterium]